MTTEPKKFRKACRRGQWAKADYILKAWKSRFYNRMAESYINSGGLR